MKRFFILAFSILAFAGCASKPAPPTEAVAPVVASSDAPAQKAEAPVPAEEQALFDAGKFKELVEKYPGSRLRSAALIRQARALYADMKWTEGTALLRSVIESSVGNPKVSAEALYHVSFGYEALGNDARMLASLKDVESLATYLPEEIGQIEVPARLGIAYMKLGQIEEGRKYFKIADERIGRFRFKNRDKKDFDFGETQYRIGQLQTHSISMENYQLLIEAQGVAQKYMMRAMEGGGRWGQEARKQLQANYMDIWNFCTSPPSISSLDAAASRRSRQDLQVRWLSHLLQLIEFANLEMGSLEVAKDGELEKFQAFLVDLEYRAKLIVYNSEELTPLTPESQMRSKLQKDMRVQPVKPGQRVIPDEEDEAPPPAAEPPVPEKANPEDPNL